MQTEDIKKRITRKIEILHVFNHNSSGFRAIEKNSYITGYLCIKLKLKVLRGLNAGPVVSCKFDNSPSVFVCRKLINL